MERYKGSFQVDGARYAQETNSSDAFYGLPEQVCYCRTCVISNQRPNSAVEFAHTSQSKKSTIHFDEEGVCDACRVAERKRAGIDWEARDRELRELCDRYRRHDGHYDCLVPGSGGKDSIYAAHKLKYEYGMHPLTVTWSPHLYTDWGWRNHRAWIDAGFDNILVTPNGMVHRLLTRLAIENLFHPFQPFIFGQKNLAPKMAARFNIPLVFYGENEAEYGNPQADTNSARRRWDYFATADKSQVFLGGTSVSDLQKHFGLEMVDLAPYLPADPAELEQVKAEVHYLGYYLKWHPQGAYYYSVQHCDFEASPERTPGTYSKYNSIDDKIDDLHYYCTYIKFGIGRATYDASQEIRSGEITREEGVALVKRFDGEFPTRFEDELWKYLSIPADKFPVASKMFEQPTMSRDYFMQVADRFRSPHLWVRENGEWRLRQGTVANV
ncbi:MAG: N-acetyl sugar amidotransferase [Rhodospirillaceae bacterium]|nr:N-acetyl sugar amidotransferase [Rhodospirillales bacterium]